MSSKSQEAQTADFISSRWQVLDIYKSDPSFVIEEKTKQNKTEINRTRQLKRGAVQSFSILVVLFDSELKLYYIFLLSLFVPKK